MTATTWQSVRAEVERRIADREWQPGDLIPGEEMLAAEFGCARATVNRALREMAQAGLLDRRRKAGTRIAPNPVRKAIIDIPIVRREIEGRGARASHRIVVRAAMVPPAAIASVMRTEPDRALLHVETVYLASDRPFAHEVRWIDPKTVPEIEAVDLTITSANEWLVLNAPLTTGEIAFSAAKAGADTAYHLECAPGDPLFVLERTTFLGARAITNVRLHYPPGYRMTATV